MGYVADGRLANLYRTEPWEACMRRIADRCGRRLEDLVRAFTPVGTQLPEDSDRLPGTLKASWRRGEVVIAESGDLRVTVETFDPVAPHVEYPTRPHLIAPTAEHEARAEARFRARHPRSRARGPFARLRFRVGGEVVYAREVHHPGTHGAYMMTRALAQLAVTWGDIAREEIVRTAREVGSAA